ncbi:MULTISPECIES: hypothetical protein [Flammeovirga]|uniref:Uncharacterized protein n=1 Tax=Flammeovirga agarivorans TaxID=2726742 RepID=A0A7X8SLN2_9BACT|nr:MULTISPECIES: hypothetical protein [Flammeovirga]NLR92514.1 hypothetical protein [Flammeovirga agarivorans]
MNFKKIYLAFSVLFTLSFTSSFAQDWYVLHVSGNITNPATNSVLQTGDMINESTSLVFADASSKAIVIQKSKGKMLLDGSKSQKNADGEFMSMVSQVLFPVQVNKQMSTRRVTFGNANDISKYFNGGSYVFMGDSVILEVDKLRYPLDEERKMAVRFTSNNEPYNRWVPNYGTENQIIIEPTKLFDGVSLDSIDMVDVYYINMQNGKPSPKHVGSFHPVFVDETKLKQELLSLKKFLVKYQDEKDQAVREELYQYVLDIYGKVDIEIFNQWTKEMEII